MPHSTPRALRRVALAAALALIAALATIAAAGTPLAAHADSSSALSSRLQAKQAAENALRAAVAADNARIGAYQGSIDSLQARLSQIETSLAASVAQLALTRSEEHTEQARLTALLAQLADSERALAASLVASYEQPPPDAITVVMEAHGFNDLLERIDFLRRVKTEDAQVIAADRLARLRVVAEAERLGALEARQQRQTTAMLASRRQVDTLRLALVDRQARYIRVRDRRSGRLAVVAAQRRHLQAELSAAEAAQAAQAAPTAGGGASGAGPAAGPSVGGFTFPLPASAAVGPGSWSEDQGVDIAAPGDTPEYAVASGTIVLHGIGGFGPWAPVLHLDTPIDGQSFVYYGHAGPQGQLPVGTHVSAGEMLGSVGPGIVGLSSGPHIEIGFADASGTPAPGTAGLMMSLLQGSYHG